MENHNFYRINALFAGTASEPARRRSYGSQKKTELRRCHYRAAAASFAEDVKKYAVMGP